MPVDPSCKPRIRKRQNYWGKYIEIFHLFSYAFYSFKPVSNPAPDTSNIFYPRSPYAGILDKKHPIAISGQGCHYLLMTLPYKIPIDTGYTDYVLIFKHLLILLSFSNPSVHANSKLLKYFFWIIFLSEI